MSDVAIFEDLRKQAHAAALGMWVFVASEFLFFAGFFVLYTAYRVEHAQGFGVGVETNALAYGSVNTAVLLVSSYTVALAVHQLRRGDTRWATRLTELTVFFGACFLVIKGAEYVHHFHEGIYPGGVGEFFTSHPDPGTKIFYTLYFCMTGLHAIHVTVGMCVLAWLAFKLHRGTLTPQASHPLALGAVYWHLIDLVWIFLWPIFYLIPGNIR